MYAVIVSAVLLAAALLLLFFSLHLLHRAKRQIAEMADALEDIKNGNGNRRVLTGIHELTAPLAFLINEIVRSYEDRISTLHQAEETNRQLMTSLSHDVRTPLTTLIGYLDAVHRGIVSGREQDGYVETARRKAHDLKDYIDVLFDWFRLGSGEFSLHMDIVDLTGLTRDILVDWIPILEDRQIAYDIRIPEVPLPTRIDPDGFLRILYNLLQNILTHSRADHMEIALSRHDGKILLTITDNGIGIEKEDLEHIFERLYKCDRGRSRKGSGLGLSIVQQLTENMDGEIRAESTPGSGTVFILSFPLHKSDFPG